MARLGALAGGGNSQVPVHLTPNPTTGDLCCRQRHPYDEVSHVSQLVFNLTLINF